MNFIYGLLTKRKGQGGLILTTFFFCMFMDRERIEVNKLAKKERGQYPDILIEKTWSIKDVLYIFGEFVLSGQEKNKCRRGEKCSPVPLIRTFVVSLLEMIIMS